MLHLVSISLLAVAFCGAGIVNMLGLFGARSDFIRWGYPRWWGIFTGALEILVALLIALPASHIGGLTIGGMIIAAAALTVIRHRDYSHLAPLGAFAILIALAAVAA